MLGLKKSLNNWFNLVFWQDENAENVVFFNSDVEIRGIYLSLILCPANF